MKRLVLILTTLTAFVCACVSVDGFSDGDDAAAPSPDANGAPLPAPITAGPPPADHDATTLRERTLFVTSATFDGSIGGFGLADSACEGLAFVAGSPRVRGRNFAALLAGRADPPQASRWIRPDGALIAIGDLATATILAVPSLDQNGLQTSASVWTGGAPGGSDGGSCSGWTSTNMTGVVGSTTDPLHPFVSDAGVPCKLVEHLYCFEL